MSRPLRELSAIFPQDSVACLQLADNGRRFPFRALTQGLFLIGSGPSCDLRLGETGVPSLHSMIRIDESGAQIALLCDGPPLIIRGSSVTCADLADSDSLQIGEFCAVYRTLPTLSNAEPLLPDHTHPQMLQIPSSLLPQNSTHPDPPAPDPLLMLESRIAENFRILAELRNQQQALADSLQQLSLQLTLIRSERPPTTPLRASA